MKLTNILASAIFAVAALASPVLADTTHLDLSGNLVAARQPNIAAVVDIYSGNATLTHQFTTFLEGKLTAIGSIGEQYSNARGTNLATSSNFTTYAVGGQFDFSKVTSLTVTYGTQLNDFAVLGSGSVLPGRGYQVTVKTRAF